MLPRMPYRLALDIGSTSIGWCLIRLNKQDEPVAIIRMGVRIFPDGRHPKDGSSLAVTRRNARQMRRRRDRLLKRKERMLSALTRLGFFPQSEDQRKALVTLDPYALRKKGLQDALTGPEFARALFHINQRRGFLSNRKTDKKDNDSGTLKKAIRSLHEKLDKEGCQTLGEWLAKRHEARLSVRARLRGNTQKEKAYDFYADRAMVEHEFDVLWQKQAGLTPTLFNEAARVELKDILLHQRPLRPVKPGRCTLLPQEERAPLALPSTQRFRIYQELNNLRLLMPDLREAPLTLEQRNKIAELLERQGEVRFKAMLKALKLPGSTKFNLEDIKRDRLKGNATTAILAKSHHFGGMWHRFPLSLQDDIVDKLLNEASESALVSWLQEATSIDEMKAENVANARLPEGYGSLSKAALGRVVPELIKDVIVYSEAVTRAGFDSHSALSHSQETGEILDALPYYGDPLRRHVAFAKDNPRNDEERFGKIANPTVHIGLNELRKVVNALIKRYGHPSEVIVEVTRDLKLSRERKLEIQRDQKIKQDLNDMQVQEACNVLGLTRANLDRAKRRELSQKMQLWIELNAKNAADRQCPYTGEQIGIVRLLSSEVEIEHILPYSMTLDDSLNNKTVAMRRANRDKGNLTPFDAFGKVPMSGYDYEAMLARAALMPKEKAKRFAPDGYQRWLKEDKDFLARALNDTAYLSRIAKEYLSLICPHNKVRAIPGRLTAMLRGKFGLNQLLSGSTLKNRNDHRHHALDAAVIGITDQGLLQRFSKASANAREMQLDRLIDEMPLPWSDYREHVTRGLSHIIVSHKPDHGYQGEIFDATIYGLRANGQVTYRQEVDGKKARPLLNREVTPFFDMHAESRHGLDNGQPKNYMGLWSRSNYCMEIFIQENGDWDFEVMPRYLAYQIVNNQPQNIAKLRHPTFSRLGKKLVMRLMIDDTIAAEIDGKLRLLRVTKLTAGGGATVTELNEANTSNRYNEKLASRKAKKNEQPFDPSCIDDNFLLTQLSPKALRAARARQVSVSPIGVVYDPGFKS